MKDIDWSDQMIEVRETAEEAVVLKSARIAEEVVVGKTGSRPCRDGARYGKTSAG